MTSYEETILQPLLADSILAKSRYATLARLLPHVTRRDFAAGETLYRAGDDASHLYLLLDGKVHLESHELARVTVDGHGRVGEESATDCHSYLTDAVAATPVSALAIPAASLATLIATNPALRVDFYFSLMNHFSGERLAPPAPRPAERPTARAADSGSWFRVAGWAATLLLPGVAFLVAPRLGLDKAASGFLAIFTATLVMWTFNLVDEYIPALFALLVTVTLGLVPASVVLSGFASDGFFMAMSILGLGSVIVASGLTYRFLLALLLWLPNRQFWHEVGLLLTGSLLTPVLPSVNGRVALETPLMTDMVEILHFKPGGKAATRLANTAFVSANLLSAAFLSSKSVNFVVLGMLSEQDRQQFQWLAWCVASAVAALALVAMHLLASALVFHNRESAHLPKEQIAAQLHLLGPIKRREWAAIVSIALFMVGVISSTVHHIPPPWLGLAILYGLLLFGFLRKSEFKADIDWPFLVYLGGLLGIIDAFNHLGLDRWLGQYLQGFGAYMRLDFRVFLALLAAAIFAVRLAIPDRAAMVLFATVLMPLAAVNGISPWLVGFAILALGEIWVLPYQCSHYGQFRELSRGLYDEGALVRFNVVLTLIKVAALYLTIPYWHALGLL